MKDERYEDGVGSTSGSNGEHKRVSWNSGVRFYLDEVDDIKEALEDQAERMGR